eukprot:CAMPEP_0180057056 /NCGR_PEP_ID=MMETSP0985-20121206/4252_1 /TAXON_ID=483367 /ORGANISM="non described non described, Strain CCMP 2436" /LENGTH=53 /DNA_ID=CAMNT_0021986881 /DNA_START=227 /DNA_END=388 /DNA_ORIENTATION=-
MPSSMLKRSRVLARSPSYASTASSSIRSRAQLADSASMDAYIGEKITFYHGYT